MVYIRIYLYNLTIMGAALHFILYERLRSIIMRYDIVLWMLSGIITISKRSVGRPPTR